MSQPWQDSDRSGGEGRSSRGRKVQIRGSDTGRPGSNAGSIFSTSCVMIDKLGAALGPSFLVVMIVLHTSWNEMQYLKELQPYF